MLFLAAILTSIDCFIIGLALKIEQKKLNIGKLLCLVYFYLYFMLFFCFYFRK